MSFDVNFQQIYFADAMGLAVVIKGDGLYLD